MGSMIQRIALVAAGMGVAVLAIWHPAPQPGLRAMPAASATPHDRTTGARRRPRQSDPRALVYVVGAVARPGLYRVAPNARVADAVAAAGGLTAAADPIAIDLAAFARDGDEIVASRFGQTAPKAARARRATRARAAAPSVALDVNEAASADLARVPGIGRSIAARIVEMRDRDGPFSSLDELLDVGGMTQSRLEHARPYLLAP